MRGNCSQRQAAGLKGFQWSLPGLADPSEDPWPPLCFPTGTLTKVAWGFLLRCMQEDAAVEVKIALCSPGPWQAGAGQQCSAPLSQPGACPPACTCVCVRQERPVRLHQAAFTCRVVREMGELLSPAWLPSTPLVLSCLGS